MRGVFFAVVVMATIGFVIAWVAEGHIDDKMAALLGVLWMFWIIASDVRRTLIDPATRWVRGQVVGGVAAGGAKIEEDVIVAKAALAALGAAVAQPR